jgi:hypothetical protein
LPHYKLHFYSHSWAHHFLLSVLDSVLSRVWEFVIWYCAVSNRLLEPTYQTYTCTYRLMLHRCCCVEAKVNYLNYKRNKSWWVDGSAVIRHVTLKTNVLVQAAERCKVQHTAFVWNWFRGNC